MQLRSWVLAFVCFVPCACGGKSTEALDAPSKCTPGQVSACACQGGNQGTQTCGDDGTYESCDCGGGTGGSGGIGGSGGTGGSGGIGGTGGTATGGSSGTVGTGGTAGTNGCENPPLDLDLDHDGWTAAEGDCDECNLAVNPGAYDFPANGLDDDCSGATDDPSSLCDDGLPEAALDEFTDAANAAKALGFCRTASGQPGEPGPWGVFSAAYVFVDGSLASLTPDLQFGSCTGTGGENSPPNPMSHGVLTAFGSVTPVVGAALVALSTGVARPGIQGDSPGGASMCTASATPPGFPMGSIAACPGLTIDTTPKANDPIALEMTIRPPTNARAFSFAFNFHSYEYPVYVCSEYADTFVALLNPGTPQSNNLVRTELGDPLSVNTTMLGVCQPGSYGGMNFPCPSGPAALAGTGFEEHGATGWWRTTVPLPSAEAFTLRFAIWDAGDEVLDSTVLLDDFRWHEEDLPLETKPITP